MTTIDNYSKYSNLLQANTNKTPTNESTKIPETKSDSVEISNNDKKKTNKAKIGVLVGVAAAAIAVVAYIKKGKGTTTVENKIDQIIATTTSEESDKFTSNLPAIIKNNGENEIKHERTYPGAVTREEKANILKTRITPKVNEAAEKIKELFGEIPTEKTKLEEFVKKESQFRETPLILAVQHGDNELVKKFLDHGANINYEEFCNRTPLHNATINGHTDTVKLLLDKGADINAIYDKTQYYSSGIRKGCDEHPIALAAAHGHNDIIQLFLDKGIEINKKNSFGQSPLILAAQYGHYHTVNMLIKKGLNINAADNSLETALHLAAGGGSRKTVKVLLTNGADITLKDEWGRTPLIRAARMGHNDIVDVLLRNGADINATDKLGQTSLHEASGFPCNDKETVKFLLDKGAEINVLDNEKKTALDNAIFYDQSDIAALLKSKGAKTGEELAKAEKNK